MFQNKCVILIFVKNLSNLMINIQMKNEVFREPILKMGSGSSNPLASQSFLANCFPSQSKLHPIPSQVHQQHLHV